MGFQTAKEITISCASLEECFQKAFGLVIEEDAIEIKQELHAAWPDKYRNPRYHDITVQDLVELTAASPNPVDNEKQWQVFTSAISGKGFEDAGEIPVGIEFKTRVIRVDWGKPDEPGKTMGVHGFHVNVGTHRSKYAYYVGEEYAVGEGEWDQFSDLVQELSGLGSPMTIAMKFADLANWTVIPLPHN